MSNDARGIISGFEQRSFQNESAMLENELGLSGMCSGMDVNCKDEKLGFSVQK